MPFPLRFRRLSTPALVLGAALLAAFVVWGLGAAETTATPTDSTATHDSTSVDSVWMTDGAYEPAVRSAITEILSDPALPAAIWGIHVIDLETGRTVYTHNGDVLLVPASNLKLYTTAAALDALGPDYRYVTRLYSFGEVTPDGTLRGDLVVRGSGDPTFGSRYVQDDPFETWAGRLRAAGIRRIEGRLIGDDDVFDDEPWAEGWDVTHVTIENYAPAASGLSYADNLVALEIAGAGGGRASVEAKPGGYVEVHNRVGVRRGNGFGPFRVRRRLGTNVVELSGSVSARYRGTVRLPVDNPTLFAMHAFAAALRADSIAVDAEVWDVDELDEPIEYEGREPLLAHVSPPMAALVARTNRRSDNFYAEQLLRTVGGGSTAGGARRVQALLEGGDVEADDLSIRDGSGLSRKDLVTPASMAGLLRIMHRHRARDAYFASLPEGGAARSTLRYRLSGVPVRAKTGSLEYVRSLSGYVTAPTGHTLAFALIANNYTVRAPAIGQAQDRIVRALATGQAVPRADAEE
ncbi:MAG TPA: D-alanyl-D-alanine carboxypeptidase/D-alanyl-D-alanine-endopeptidase [Rubricoccaceae bacterium]|nr:D-alanyl-D-alanine carboxypeptidase/D-alanyl-D-alanine-endopeptidase [Rubricoccaceae bacterium]